MTDTITEQLVQLCEETLKIPRPRTDRSLVVQGASSMRLMQLIARIYEQFDVFVELSEVMEDVTIPAIAAMIAQRRGAARDEATAPGVVTEAPIDDLQLPFWQLREHPPAMAAYNEAVSYLLEGPLDVAACEAVFAEILAAQPALRTAFVEVDGRPLQRELSPETMRDRARLEVVDLSDRPDPLRACEEEFRAIYGTRFDLGRPPCFRLVLWKVGPSRWVLSYVGYHIVADLWSVDVVRREAAALYGALTGAPERTRHARPVTLAPSAGRHFLPADEAHWVARLSPPPKDIDLSARRRPPIKTYAGDMVSAEVPGALVAALDAARGRLGVTMSSLTFAACALLLGRLCDESDVTVGVPFLVRDQAGAQDVVGMFLNVLPVRVAVDPRTTVGELVAACHEELRQAFKHGKYPSHHLASRLGRPSRLSRSPLYEELFTYYEPAPDMVATSPDTLGVREIEMSRGTAKLDMSLFVTRRGDRLFCKAEYATALFSRADAATFLSDYEAALVAVAADAASRVSDVASLVPLRRRPLAGAAATASVEGQ